MAVIALVGATVPIVLTWLFSRGEWVPIVAVEDVDANGVAFDARYDVFVVDRPEGLLGLSAIISHAVFGPERAEFCRSSRWFEGPHGERFDQSGIYVAGPASRGMDRYPVRVREGMLEVQIDGLMRGPPRGTEHRQPEGAFCT